MQWNRGAARLAIDAMSDLPVSPVSHPSPPAEAVIDRTAFIAEIERLVGGAVHLGASVWPMIDRMLGSLLLPRPAAGDIDTTTAKSLLLHSVLLATKVPALIRPAFAAAEKYLDANAKGAPRHHLILKRPDPAYALSTPEDFLLGPAVAANCFPLHDATAYIADYEARELHFVVSPPDAPLASQPFFYMAQRNAAISVSRVAFDQVHRIYPPPDTDVQRPLILLSMGRCGSTLLGRMLGTGGSVTIPESDIFSQAAELAGIVGPGASAPRADHDAIRVLQAAVQSFAMQANCTTGRLVLKMRTHANGAVAPIAAAFPHARFVFLFRDVAAWVHSFVASFRVPAEGLVEILRSAILACAYLHRRGMPLVILSYEDIQRDPEAALARIWGRNAPLPPEQKAAIAAIRASDSQESTSISRSALRHQELTLLKRETLEAFRAQWRTARPAEDIAALGLPY